MYILENYVYKRLFGKQMTINLRASNYIEGDDFVLEISSYILIEDIAVRFQEKMKFFKPS